tara:strand:+ start:842 stop:1066 length:225 start_codon:yes stop_codon:yes gene_type:complete
MEEHSPDFKPMNDIDINSLIQILQKKVSDLTLTNIVLEAKIKDLTNRLNSNIENPQQENAVNGNENPAKEVNDT